MTQPLWTPTPPSIAAAAEPPLLPVGDQLFQRLLRHRIIFLGQQVDDELANRISAELVLLAAEDPKRDISIYITGDDPVLTDHTARQVVAEMQKLPMLRDARINSDMPRPEILVKPHLDLASQLGVTVEAISETIRIGTLGDLDQNSAKFSLADRQVPIRVSLTEDSRKDLSTLENLPVPTAGGGAVPLKAVADISFGVGPTRVRRYNQSRRISLEADLNNVELGPAMKAIHNLPTLSHLPQGVRLVENGSARWMNELFTNFMLAMATGVLMV